MANKKIWEFPENTNPQGNLVFLVDENFTTQKLSLSGLTSSSFFSQFLTDFRTGSISGNTFSGDPKKVNVVLDPPYLNTNYSITITGTVNRLFTWESKTATGFTINANANTPFTENVDWVTMSYNI